MNVLFLIPARGGSKGFPGKNLALLAGIPLVGRAARLGRQCLETLGAEGRVVCSTDDPAIAEAAREWGAETPFVRSAELATDEAKTLDVVRHALDALGGAFDAVVLLQPTSPLTEPEDVLGAVESFQETGGPVVSVCLAEHPPEWHQHMDGTGRLVPILAAPGAHQRQRVESAYRPNGSVYVASPAQVRAGGFWTPQTRGFVMPSERSVDVDDARDLTVAHALLTMRPVAPIEIAGRKIGPGHPCFVIAEAGVNHNGSVELARKLVDAAVAAGADAVKFQTFRAEKVISRAAPKADYQKANTGASESQLEMAKRLELTPDEHRRVFEYCRQKGILYLSSPFDDESVELLAEMGVEAIKLGSGELTNSALLAQVARQGKPVLLSTGMADLKEIRTAVELLRGQGDPPVALFHCVSNYPALARECNLAALATLRSEFGVPVGWSDHTLGTHISVAAVALGANLVEKHFTLDRGLPGPDHVASLEPPDLAELVRTIREAEAAIGSEVKRRQASEENTAAVARRSLHAGRPIAAGAVVREEDLILLRPGTGIPANHLPLVMGRRAKRALAEGAALRLEDLE